MNAQQAADSAKQYLEDIIAFLGVNVKVECKIEDDVLELSVPSSDINSILIGRNAETLRSLQHVISAMLRNKDAAVTRVNVDVADYKRQHADKVAAQAREWIEEVRRTGNTHIAHLNAADRRVVHRLADEYDDIHTFSEGDGRDRHIIIAQKSS